jgi:hypothetical protein
VSAEVSYPPPSVSGGADVVCSPSSGSTFAEGSTTVTCTATDGTGDAEVCSFQVTVIVPPLNDDYNYATPITTLPFVDMLNTRTATTASDDPTCYGRKATVWYTYTPEQDMVVTAKAYESNYSASVSAYLGSRGALSQIACDYYPVVFTAHAGQTVSFMIPGYYGGGDLVFRVSATPAVGLCTPSPGLKVCDDRNACTRDACDSELGCQHSPILCRDGNPRTTDSCDPRSGCVFAARNSPASGTVIKTPSD